MRASNQLMTAVKKLRGIVESLGAPIAFRKLHGILNALEMQVEDGRYQRHAVARFCEALLAAAEGFSIPEETFGRLEELACKVVAVVEGRR